MLKLSTKWRVFRHLYAPNRGKSSSIPFPRSKARSNGLSYSITPFRTGALALFTALIAYDGYNDFVYCGATWRFFRSLKTASLIVFDYFLLNLHVEDEDYLQQQKAVHQKSANRLLQTCLLNGGLYIKVGQGFAAINHILPKEYTSTLSLLQDECLPTSMADVQKVFKREFGELPEEIYEEFNYKPVAAASLAQVFKAKLRSGEDVAVKVQYKDLYERFTSDLGTIIFLQNMVEFFFKSYNFGWILRDLRKNLLYELDFINEAENSEKCAAHLQKFDYVHVPKVHWNLTRTRVMTSEWIDGFKISDINNIKKFNFKVRDIDIKLYKMFAEQIFCTGFVHADPHPGNILLRENPKTRKVELVLLDHGLYEVLPEDVRKPLCEFWESTVLRDEQRMQIAARKLNIHDHIKFAEVLFQQPIRIHGGRIKSKLTDDDINYMQEVAQKNFELIMSTLKEMPRNMLFIVRNLNTIRAIGRQHGDVVDRPRIMATHAQYCMYKNSSFLGFFYYLYRRMIFEYCLWKFAVKMECINLYFNILYQLGRAPESARTIFKDLRSIELS